MKRPGRPPLADDDRSVPVSFSLPKKQFDDLCQQAHRDQVSLPEIIRRKIRKADGRAVDPNSFIEN
jgi:hypothetical protein